MSTTLFNLPEDFTLRAAVDAQEKYAEFVAQAKVGREKMLKSGEGFEVDEVHDYLRQRAHAAQSGHTKDPSATNAPKATSWRVR